VYAYDISSGMVTQAATLPHGVAHAPLVALRGLLYLIGGRDQSGSPVRTIMRIDPRTGVVGPAGTLPMPLADAAAVRSGSSIVVIGGAGASPSAGILALHPAN
jgi:N-acetylneuraminic acid mutarotase